ncbi:HERV-H LTR-associating protein 1 homolog [Acanthochromis polyacanthus]|uniref:HERV-H LTR-associating protein 1 homolog n=1 Tax=Acanthochromis polyacanthus TaxID=80966 RepID=UPI00223443E2|nr:HERV-H LTR-associating protein 1 homolog [Acanthochromis polyacanthus]
MALSWRFTQHPRLCFIIAVSAVFLLLLISRELPAEHIDPAAIDLTLLVNTLINSSQSGSRQLFSLLSVTSYSSLALHKLTLLVYNISSIKNIESNKFRRRFCYCVTNETNDLTDFTAILLDVMGNSTSYLHELFKSASILSVSQRNNSDCIYICVMAGKMGREVPELWQVDSITPLFNQTIVEGPHRDPRTPPPHPPTPHTHPTPRGGRRPQAARKPDTGAERPTEGTATSPSPGRSPPEAGQREPEPGPNASPEGKNGQSGGARQRQWGGPRIPTRTSPRVSTAHPRPPHPAMPTNPPHQDRATTHHQPTPQPQHPPRQPIQIPQPSKSHRASQDQSDTQENPHRPRPPGPRGPPATATRMMVHPAAP